MWTFFFLRCLKKKWTQQAVWENEIEACLNWRLADPHGFRLANNIQKIQNHNQPVFHYTERSRSVVAWIKEASGTRSIPQTKHVCPVFKVCWRVTCATQAVDKTWISVFQGNTQWCHKQEKGKGRLGTFMELAGSPLARHKRWNNKQAIRRQRERTQSHCETLLIIKADFSLEGDDYLRSSVVHK